MARNREDQKHVDPEHGYPHHMSDNFLTTPHWLTWPEITTCIPPHFHFLSLLTEDRESYKAETLVFPPT
jgi:hypothetical protein